MGTEIQTRTVSDIRANSQLIQDVLKSVLKEGVHYDKPYFGATKFSLLKPGAEKILSTFLIGIRLKVEDLGNSDCCHYRVTCEGYHIPTGTVMGEGIGECSSDEKKFKWVRALNEQEYEEADPSRRQTVWKKKDKYHAADYQEKQVRSNPADVQNTVLKMAKKRAAVDLCLTCTAASDIFDADMDKDEEGNRERAAAEHYQRPQEKQPERQQEPSGNVISEKQRKRMYAIQKNSDKTDEMVKAHLAEHGLSSSKDIPPEKYDGIITWIETPVTNDLGFGDEAPQGKGDPS